MWREELLQRQYVTKDYSRHQTDRKLTISSTETISHYDWHHFVATLTSRFDNTHYKQQIYYRNYCGA